MDCTPRKSLFERLPTPREGGGYFFRNNGWKGWENNVERLKAQKQTNKKRKTKNKNKQNKKQSINKTKKP